MISEDPAYREYRLSPDFRPWFESRLKKRMWTLMAVQFVVITVVILLFVNWHSPVALVVVGLVLALFAVVVVIKVPVTLRQQVEDYAEFRLYVGPAGVRRVMGDHPDLSLSKSDIQKIVVRKGEGIVITGAGGIKLWIPEHMDQRDELERRLDELEPLERTDAASGFLGPRYLMLRTILIMLGTLVGIVVVVLIGGFTLLQVLTIIGCSFMIWKYRGNPNVGRRVVRSNITIIILMVLLLLLHFAKQVVQ